MDKRKCKIILENGAILYGKMFGFISEVYGELVFNTSHVGYQQIITDPSYSGQIIVFTFPSIGNHGTTLNENESDNFYARAIIVREKCDFPNNFKNEMTLNNFLKLNKTVGVECTDTRLLTTIIRKSGNIKALITPDLDKTFNNLGNFSVPSSIDLILGSSIRKKKIIYSQLEKTEKSCRVGVIDLGIKNNIINELKKRVSEILLLPFDTSAEEILKENLDVVFISNGPGDPRDVHITLKTIKTLIGKIPLRGICMGHQLLALAFNAKIEKLKFGHHGANHPVKETETGKIFITSQNHNYNVCNIPDNIEITYTNLNDNTCEGIRNKELNIESVQFHPEASPGPIESNVIFDNFMLNIIQFIS